MDKIGGNRAHPGPPPTARSRPFQFRPPPPRSSDQPSPWTFFNSSSGDGNSTPNNFSDGFLPIEKRARRGLFQPPVAPAAAAPPPTSPNLQGHDSIQKTSNLIVKLETFFSILGSLNSILYTVTLVVADLVDFDFRHSITSCTASASSAKLLGAPRQLGTGKL